MTVGEKIQYYRKKQELSQEELGSRLFVSRQTVSLWEMDKTMPTIDNLQRLCKIFDVTMDELLTDGDVEREAAPEVPDEQSTGEAHTSPEEQKTPEAIERCVFQYDEEEAKRIFKEARGRALLLCIIYSLLSLSGLIIAFLYGINIPLGILIGGFFAVSLSILIQFLKSKKQERTHMPKLLDSVYDLSFSENSLTVLISDSKTGEVTRSQKIRYEDLKPAKETKTHYFLSIGADAVALPKNEQTKRALALTAKAKPPKIERPKPGKGLQFLSIVLMIACFGAFALWFIIGFSVVFGKTGSIRSMFASALYFLPVPALSILFYVICKRKNVSFVRNLVAGIIMAVIFCFIGLLSTMVVEFSSDDPSLYQKAEEALSLDLPEYREIRTYEETGETESDQRMRTDRMSIVRFKARDAEAFEQQLPDDARWLSEIPTQLIGVIPGYRDRLSDTECFVLCNLDTGELNKAPGEGTAHLLFINYYMDTDEMHITEYELTYVR